jgi:hypothetical protein
MPFQVNGQAVTTKSSRLLQVAGGDRAFVVTAGAVFVTMMSSADASVAQAASRSKPDIAERQAIRAIASPLSFYRATFHPMLIESSDQLRRRSSSI